MDAQSHILDPCFCKFTDPWSTESHFQILSPILVFFPFEIPLLTLNFILFSYIVCIFIIWIKFILSQQDVA